MSKFEIGGISINVKKVFFTLCVSLAFCENVKAEEVTDRGLQLFAGAGLERVDMNLTSNGTRSHFSGGGSLAELGMKFTFPSSFGLSIAAKYENVGSLNSDKSGAFMESASLESIGGRLGLFISFFELGAGQLNQKLNVNTLSEAAGAVSSQKSGLSNFAYISLNFGVAKAIQASVEVNSTVGKLNDVELVSYAGLLKLSIAF